jgi:branched-chain amino acid transport system substrate-binding protein
VVLFEGITPGAVDYTAVVQKIRQNGAEAVVFGGFHPEAASIVSQMRKKNNKIPFLSDDGVKDDTFIKVAGRYAEGVYATGPRETGNNPMTKAAEAAHRQAFKADPGAFFLNGYAAAQVIVAAIQKARSTKGEDIARVLRGSQVSTTLGRISFDRNGDALGVGFSIYQVKNGIYAEVKR